MPIKLYALPNSCALATHIALEWINKPYELKLLKRGQNRESEYLQVNPKGKVPAVVLEDGHVLTEAAAILVYLAEQFPQANLGTSNDPYERYELSQLLAYMTSEVHADFAPHFAPQRFINDESQYNALRDCTYKRLHEHYTSLNERLEGKKHPIGIRRTVADPYLYVLTRWVDQTPLGIKNYPNLKRFRDQMSADTGVLRAVAMQGIPL
ncbi:glutathione S-transferase [Rivularia sp. IAM M-261]|nr:glutathione S-transferase [Rivularia sp. IAM M-261]